VDRPSRFLLIAKLQTNHLSFKETFDMKSRTRILLSLSSACLVVLGTQLGNAQGPSASTDTESVNTQTASGLVRAEAALTKSLDARKDQPGAAFEARLNTSVHLKDGTELPRGTLLQGKVVAPGTTTTNGTALALVFTNAKLKDGKDVPIQATIVGLSEPALGTDPSSSYDGPVAWNGSATEVDASGVLNNVDLHSKIGGDNSGTLAASGKGDVKLSAGSRLSLAIGQKAAN
jgi:hypothetical protein